MDPRWYIQYIAPMQHPACSSISKYPYQIPNGRLLSWEVDQLATHKLPDGSPDDFGHPTSDPVRQRVTPFANE